MYPLFSPFPSHFPLTFHPSFMFPFFPLFSLSFSLYLPSLLHVSPFSFFSPLIFPLPSSRFPSSRFCPVLVSHSPLCFLSGKMFPSNKRLYYLFSSSTPFKPFPSRFLFVVVHSLGSFSLCSSYFIFYTGFSVLLPSLFFLTYFRCRPLSFFSRVFPLSRFHLNLLL